MLTATPFAFGAAIRETKQAAIPFYAAGWMSGRR